MIKKKLAKMASPQQIILFSDSLLVERRLFCRGRDTMKNRKDRAGDTEKEKKENNKKTGYDSQITCYRILLFFTTRSLSLFPAKFPLVLALFLALSQQIHQPRTNRPLLKEESQSGVVLVDEADDLP